MSRADPIRDLPARALRACVLQGIRAGRPELGPTTVHIDITNGCNAACVTCWDHSPLLETARPGSWKRQRLPWERFSALVADLDGMGSVRAVVISGMGEPLTHPDVYRMLAAIKARGWHLTLLSNLVAAEPERLADSGVDNLLVGVHGITSQTYSAFHPGWTERHFFTMCSLMRRMTRAGARVRHVQVINRDTAPELVEMVRFGRIFQADRVNFKLASLAGGTEGCAALPEQLEQLAQDSIPQARALAAQLGVPTNLALFADQVQAALGQPLHTTPMAEVGCYMGHVYTRVTVQGEVLYCCNPAVQVGHLDLGPLSEQWWGPRWQAMREQLARGEFLDGCERCGKFEQNRKWAERVQTGSPT